MPNDPATPTASLGDILKLVVDAVKAVEAAYPEGGKGKEKFDAVYGYIMQFAPLASVGAQLIETALPALINLTVAFFNRIGAFVHSVQANVEHPTA